MNSANLTAKIRDLAVLAHRGNVFRANPLMDEIAVCLRTLIQPDSGATDPEANCAQQALFALEEVRTLLSQSDFGAAASAARDAAREWTAARGSAGSSSL